MKSLMMLWQAAATEWGGICGACTLHDQNTVVKRVGDEGLSFFTITLPKFCKDLEKGLADGFVGPDLFAGFKRRGRLPNFLGGFMDFIFDRASGLLLEQPSTDAIQAVRWLTSVYGKLELRTTLERESAAVDGFVLCEREVKAIDKTWTESLKKDFARVSWLLWGQVLLEADEAIYKDVNRISDHLVPRHGPGATADRLRGNAKFDLSYWPERLQHMFPFGEYAVANYRYDYVTDRVHFAGPSEELPVKLVAVPKTMKTPRLIAVEPTAMQYMQQAVKGLLVPLIQRDLPMGRIVGFSDQDVNRRLAREGSLTQSLATLDLSEASDRVSNQLVREMVSRVPHLAEALDATRSRKVDVPGYGVLRLAKFASMGSALTFPIEAMVFATVVFIGIERELGRPLKASDIQSLAPQVRVFGDDIIVPTDYAQPVVRALELYGFKVNTNKSFWTGKFRESCGREYYNGDDVSVDRLRKIVYDDSYVGLPQQLGCVREIESLVNFRNKCYMRGLWQTASWLDEWIRPVLNGFYPDVDVKETTPEEEGYSRSHVLGRWSFLGYQSERTHRKTHSPLVRGYVVEYRIPESTISGEGALLKTMQKQGVEPFADCKHLERSGRPEAARIKLRWTSPF